jgi:hypothetical protein
MSTKFIPLLSEKPIEEYSPESFCAHVRSLHLKKAPKAPKLKKQSEFKASLRIKKNGTLSVVTKRDPRYITELELAAFLAKNTISSEKLRLSLNEIGVEVRESHSSTGSLSSPAPEPSPELDLNPGAL